MSGFDSETATAPTDELVIWPSVTGAHFAPPSVVFHRPPPTAPKYASFGRPFTPETAIERPPRSGPTLRHLKALTNAGSSEPSAAADCAARSGRTPKCHPAETARTAAAARNERYLDKPIMTPSLLERNESSIARTPPPTPPLTRSTFAFAARSSIPLPEWRPDRALPIQFSTAPSWSARSTPWTRWCFSACAAASAPGQIFQSIAAGVYGRAASRMGLHSIGLGILLHYLIAFLIVAFFYALSRAIPLLRKQTLICRDPVWRRGVLRHELRRHPAVGDQPRTVRAAGLHQRHPHPCAWCRAAQRMVRARLRIDITAVWIEALSSFPKRRG